MPYENHPYFSDPPPGNKLWRYMSFRKFESLLERKALFFCRADKFADSFEGASPKKEVEYRYQWSKNLARELRRDFDHDAAVKQSEMLSNFQKSLRSRVIINCWHYNSHESDAMWGLYLKDNEGVAILSNPQRLKECFHLTELGVRTGKVRYLDYQSDIYFDGNEFPVEAYNVSIPFIHKRKHFEHEKEYRAIITLDPQGGPTHDWNKEEFEKGKMIPVDVKKLIAKVIVHPQAEEKFIEKVRETIKSYRYEFEVAISEMNAKPLF